VACFNPHTSLKYEENSCMKVSTRARAINPSALATRLFASTPRWQPQLMSIVFAAGAFLSGPAAIESQRSATSAGELALAQTAAGICSDSSGKRAAKRAAREAKKKERAHANKSDDHSLAKAKSSTRGSHSSGSSREDDPLEGL
jgi:hypothetical protein